MEEKNYKRIKETLERLEEEIENYSDKGYYPFPEATMKSIKLSCLKAYRQGVADAVGIKKGLNFIGSELSEAQCKYAEDRIIETLKSSQKLSSKKGCEKRFNQPRTLICGAFNSIKNEINLCPDCSPTKTTTEKLE